jgi:multidrug efflux system outer membrane protein
LISGAASGRSNEAAIADLLSKEENRRAVVLQLSSVASYFNLLQFDAQLDIAKRPAIVGRIRPHRSSPAQAGDDLSIDTDQFEAERPQRRRGRRNSNG